MNLLGIANTLYGDKYCYEDHSSVNRDAEILKISNGSDHVFVCLTGIEAYSAGPNLAKLLIEKFKKATKELRH